MHYAQFTSAIPLDHLPRALDELRRSGFQLCGVSVSAGARGSIAGPVSDARADIRIEFDTGNRFAAETYLARIAGMPGVQDLQGGTTRG